MARDSANEVLWSVTECHIYICIYIYIYIYIFKIYTSVSFKPSKTQ